MYIPPWAHTDIHTYIPTHVRSFARSFVCSCVRSFDRSFVHSSMHALHTYIHLFIHPCMHVYTYMHTSVLTDRHTKILAHPPTHTGKRTHPLSCTCYSIYVCMDARMQVCLLNVIFTDGNRYMSCACHPWTAGTPEWSHLHWNLKSLCSVDCRSVSVSYGST